MNQKGLSESDKQLYWTLIVLPFLVVIGAVVFYVVYSVIGVTGGVFPGLEEKIYETRLLYSPNCFAYQDPETSRVYTSTIDLSKANQEVFSECVPLTSLREPALRAEISYLENNEARTISVTSDNWDDKTTSRLRVKKYPVKIKGYGDGVMNLIYRD